MAVRPTCCVHLKSSAPCHIQLVRQASRISLAPHVPSLRRSGQRIADRRCEASGGGRGAEGTGLVLADKAFQVVLPPYGVRPIELCRPEKLKRVPHTAGPLHTPCSSPPRSVRSVRSGQRIADRRCARRWGGWGKGRAASAGVVLANEAFQGGCSPYGVRSTEPCPPEKLIRVSHTAGLSTYPMCPSPASRRSARSGQRIERSDGALGRLGKGRGECWARARWRSSRTVRFERPVVRSADRRCALRLLGGRGSSTRRFRVAPPNGVQPKELRPPDKPQPCSAYSWSVSHLLSPRPAPRVPALRSIRPADRGPAVRRGARGEGGAESAVSAYEAFQGWCPHMVV